MASSNQSDNPLDPAALCDTVNEALSQTQTAGTPAFNHGVDLTMALFHAMMINLGFRFLGLGEEANTSPVSATDDHAKVARATAPLPTEWNRTRDSYSFRYKHHQSQFTFLVKAVKVASKLIIHGMAIEDGSLHTLELSVPTFINPNFSFPYPSSGANIDTSEIRNAFASEEQLRELIYQFKIKILQALIPGLNKEGYEETRRSTTGSTSSRPPRANPQPDRDPLRDPTRPGGHPRPIRPFDPFRQGGIGGVGGFQPTNPYGIGDVDLDPFAASPGLVPRPFAGGGMHPGGGMIVDPSHPMFGGVGGVPGPSRGGGGIGPYAGPGAPPLPPGAVPPGARFDPIGPFGPRPGGGPSGPRPGFGGGGFGGGSGSFGNNPDSDDFPPPGNQGPVARGPDTGEPFDDDDAPPSNYDTMFM